MGLKGRPYAITAEAACAHLYILLRDLYLRGVDVVNEQAKCPAPHLFYPHPLRPALCHFPCRHTRQENVLWPNPGEFIKES